MPAYAYMCNVCGSTTERLAPMGEAPEDLECVECRGTMRRRYYAPYLRTETGMKT